MSYSTEAVFSPHPSQWTVSWNRVRVPWHPDTSGTPAHTWYHEENRLPVNLVILNGYQAALLASTTERRDGRMWGVRGRAGAVNRYYASISTYFDTQNTLWGLRAHMSSIIFSDTSVRSLRLPSQRTRVLKYGSVAGLKWRVAYLTIWPPHEVNMKKD